MPEESRKKLSLIAANYPEFANIASVLEISEEAFETWIYDVKEKNKSLFDAIINELIYGIEINAVFRKPIKESEQLLLLRQKTNKSLEKKIA